MTTSQKTVPSKATKPPVAQRRRRLAKPATTPRAIEAARRRRDELLAVLAVRDEFVASLRLKTPTLDRAKLTPSQLHRLEISEYARASAAYLDTHEKFFHAAARKLEARHIPLEDLVQATKIGGIRALDKFDANLVKSGTVTSFLSYARWWVRCEVGKLFEEESLVKIPATAKKTTTEMRQQIERHAELVGTAPESLTDDEVAAALSLPLEKVKLHRNLHLGHEHYDVSTTLSASRDRSKGRVGEDDEVIASVVVQRLREQQDEIDADAAEKQRGLELDVAVSRLPALHRRLVAGEFGLDISEDKEALRVTLPGSIVAVKALLKAALGRLRGLLGDDVEAATA